MIHFVPAWYNSTRPWYSTDRVWFQGEGASVAESDDTVTQLRVFNQGSEDAKLLVLNYAPSLRRFLHAYNIVGVSYWSFFDEIQGLEDDYTRPLNFLELDWPDDVSFFYNPFLVTVMRGSDVYARVYLAQEGTLQSIRYYGDGMPTVERIFDDRGFLSSVLMHNEDGQAMTQYYHSRGGDVIVSEDVASGRIDIVQNDDERFREASYDSWEALIKEFLGEYLRQPERAHDTVVLAIAEQHNKLLSESLDRQTLVLSRSETRAVEMPSELLTRTDAIFTDSTQLSYGNFMSSVEGEGEADGWSQLPVLSIYPLEYRASFGASANEATVYISLFVDNITSEELDYVIAAMAPQLVSNEHTRLLVCTFRSHDLDYLQGIKRVIAGYQNLDLQFAGDDDTRLSVDLGETDMPEEKIHLAFLDGPAKLIHTMAKTRVLIDLGQRVNPRLAAEAIGAGVPQINRYEQELCTHLINGYALRDDSELGAALDYFLLGLEHWNQSLVQCRVLVELFSAQEVLARWELIKEGVRYAGSADRL